MNTTSSGYGKTNGSHRCSCCPYGYHIDVDFVQYCEALISALYGKRCPSSTSSRGSLSLHRPPKRRILTSTVSLPSDDQTYQWLIDQNYNKSNGNTNGHANRHHANSQQQHIYGSPSPHHFNSVAFLARLRPVSNSSSRVNDILNPPSPVDKSLTDAVELFEQVLKEHEANVASTPSSPLGLSTTPRRGSFPRINGDPTLSPSSPYNRISESLPTSPAPSSTSNNQNNYNNNHSNNNAHNGVNKAFLSQFRDQLAISVQKMKDLEQQVKDIPVLRQKILLLQAERKRLLKQIKGDTNNLTDSSIDADGLEYDDINSPLNASRIEELEKSGLITPPMTRRKFLIKDSKEESVEELRSLPSRISNLSPVSCKNITLEDTLYRLRDGFTQTDLPVKIKVKDASTTISDSLPGSPTKKARKPPIPSKSELVLNKVTSISIRPTSLAPRPSLPPPPSPAGPAGTTVQSAEPLVLSSTSTTPQSTPSTPTQYPSSSPISVGQPKVYRSIGVSTNIAPSLPRRSFASSKESEVKKYQQEEDPKQQKPSAALPSQLLMSRGTDPLTLEVREAVVQVSPKTLHASVGTDYFSLRETGINCDYKKDLGIRGSSRSSQTERPKEILRSDKIIQVNEKCSHCELKQMETIGVGNDSVYPPPMIETGINTEQISSKMVDSMISSFSSMASSIQSIKLCDKCNETITNLAREVVKDKTPSPVMGSRIPRLSAPPLPPSSQPPLQPNLPASTASATTITTITSPSSSIPPMAISLPIKTTNLSNKIIIEEGNDDEILVYRNPNINLGSRKHRSNFPSMMTPQVDLEGIRLLDEACKITDSESEDAEEESFSSSEGTYILDNDTSSPNRLKEMVEPSKELRAALKVLNDSLSKPDRSNKPATAKSLQIVEKEWFSIAACKDSDPSVIEVYLDCFESFSAHLLNKIVNLTDSSGNTAMHYAISHSNFDVVSVLLDSKVCDVNKQNKAGYTAIMLVSTARVTNETQKEVIRRLFSLGDVNIRAKQNGQTALMLASSHGQFTTCKLLLEAGAALNVQDNDGSTALMCATEHGHVDVVKLLLSHPDCDPTIADNDKSTAMTIAMECGRKDIAVLLYASCNMFGRGSSPYASLRRSQSKAITTQLQRTGSFTSHSNSGNRAFQLAPSPPTRSRHPSTTSSHSRSRK